MIDDAADLPFLNLLNHPPDSTFLAHKRKFCYESLLSEVAFP